MNFDPADAAMIARTRPAFAESPDHTAAVFYGELFRAAPQLRPLFPADMTGQGRKLCAMLTAAIAAAGNPEALEPVAADLARRHVGYGVEADHYPVVGRALLAALARLGATPEQIDAWRRIYAELSRVMIAAASGRTIPA